MVLVDDTANLVSFFHGRENLDSEKSVAFIVIVCDTKPR